MKGGVYNMLMVGPPGSGKAMLPQRLPTILPDLTFEEALETTKVYSAMGLMGGSQIPQPGEVSLSHNPVPQPGPELGLGPHNP
jgi:magnesium chelatase family protein